MFIKPQQDTQHHAGSNGGPRPSVWSWIGIFFVLGMLFGRSCRLSAVLRHGKNTWWIIGAGTM